MARIPDDPSLNGRHWQAVASYITDLPGSQDTALNEVLAANAATALPPLDVSPAQGKLLALFTTMIGAHRVLDIDTLGAYGAIWFARALPTSGHVVTIEANPARAEVARANLMAAGVTDRATLRIGKPLDILPLLEAESAGPFDLIFIDADKPNNSAYLGWALRLSRPGTVIIGDNVVRGGAVTDADSTDANVQGVRGFLELITADPRLDATALQTVGEKGWDGFVLAVVRDSDEGEQ